MRTLLLVALLAPGFASAQAQATASFSINLPVILPRLVIVQPGIQVVPDQDVEVFFVDGFYWTRRDDRWYRSKDHRGGWSHASRGVPPGLVRAKPGKYRRYRPPAARVEERHDRHDHDRGDRGRGDKDKHEKKHDKRD